MNIQLPLFKNRELVPLRNAGIVIEGFRVVTASDMACARSAVTMARVTGSVGDEQYHLEYAGPEVMPDERHITRWAIVERINN